MIPDYRRESIRAGCRRSGRSVTTCARYEAVIAHLTRAGFDRLLVAPLNAQAIKVALVQLAHASDDSALRATLARPIRTFTAWLRRSGRVAPKMKPKRAQDTSVVISLALRSWRRGPSSDSTKAKAAN
jgi:hypothetical protein